MTGTLKPHAFHWLLPVLQAPTAAPEIQWAHPITCLLILPYPLAYLFQRDINMTVFPTLWPSLLNHTVSYSPATAMCCILIQLPPNQSLSHQHSHYNLFFMVFLSSLFTFNSASRHSKEATNLKGVQSISKGSCSPGVIQVVPSIGTVCCACCHIGSPTLVRFR